MGRELGGTKGYKSCAWQVTAGPGLSAGQQRQVNVLRLEKSGYSRVTNLASCLPKPSNGQRLRKKRKLQHRFTWSPCSPRGWGATSANILLLTAQCLCLRSAGRFDTPNEEQKYNLLKCKNYKSKLMYFHVYNCPNDRQCLVLVSGKHRLNENVIFVPVNQRCVETYQWIKISLSHAKLKKKFFFFPYACMEPPLYL